MTIKALPQMPEDINLFVENGKCVFRVGEARSVYVYDKDKDGMPTCVDQCSVLWPPILASAGATAVGDFSLVKRADGSEQWRYRNRPLYMYSKDKAGQVLGDGVGGVWHVIAPC